MTWPRQFGLFLFICMSAFAIRGQATPITRTPVKMAITIDDLPNGSGDFKRGEWLTSTLATIAALKAHGVKHAMAFVNTDDVIGNPEKIACLREWVRAGYELGNHTHAHTGLSQQSAEDFIGELIQTEKVLAELKLPLVKMIRYPFLQEGLTLKTRMAVRKWLRENGYALAPPTVDTWDWDTNIKWQEADTPAARRRVIKNGVELAVQNFHRSKEISEDLFGRQIAHTFLGHQTVAGGKLLPLILDRYEQEGVRYISIEEALRDPVYRLDPGLAGEFGNLLEMLSTARDVENLESGERLHSTDYIARKIKAVSAPLTCHELFAGTR